MDDYDLLIKIFNSITPIPAEHNNILRKIFKPQLLSSGEFYCKAGEPTSTFSLLISGITKAYFITAAGEEYIKTFRKSGQFVASYRALILKENSTYDAQALTDCHLLTAKYSDLEILMEEHFCWQKLVRIVNQHEFISKGEREYQFLTMPLKDRYLQFLKDFKDIHHLIPQNQIASFLGVKPPSLSRMIRDENLKNK